MTTPFTLKELLDKYKVIIPQIQRDYAQGRNTETALRKGFIARIKRALEEGEASLNLDFIYGYTKFEDQVFVPLDGQQRLTTLWLLHWYTAPREKNTIIDDVKTCLAKFTYETRVSSRRFCSDLIYRPLEIRTDIAVSKQITDTPWFKASWSVDPTVTAILNMLDTLQEEISASPEVWDALTHRRKVTFDFIDVKSEEFKLTDELYIKMNSRGKPLTPFENFKAQFSELLASGRTNYAEARRMYQDVPVTYQQYFAFKIDSVWMDLFWNYRQKTGSETDGSIYRFIRYVAEFLFFKNHAGATGADIKPGFEFLNAVFLDKKNIDFLFDALDFLSSLENTGSFFEGIFNNVSTFDQWPKDYFLRAITDTGFDVKDKTILYAILSYCNHTGILTADDELADFVRIVRNLLLSVRQVNQKKRNEYASNLRLPDVSEYCRFIDAFIWEIKTRGKPAYQVLPECEFAGFTKENIEAEQAKAAVIIAKPGFKQCIQALEDHPQVQGNTANFKPGSDNIRQRTDAFLAIWSPAVKNTSIVRAFLTFGDYSVVTHSSSSLGEIRFFGDKDNWNRILTAADKNERTRIADLLDAFLHAFACAEGGNPSEKLQYLIDHYKPTVRDWRYYFVKYEAITDNALNVFTWADGRGFDINCLGNSGVFALHSYHLNPYLVVLKQGFIGNQSIKHYYGRFTDTSFLSVDHKIYFRCKSGGWQVTTSPNCEISENLAKTYQLNRQGNGYMLTETTDHDRIEIAVDFMNDLLKEEQGET